jgi:23S rRNA pseudoU1915 N3-methylase RlmH
MMSEESTAHLAINQSAAETLQGTNRLPSANGEVAGSNIDKIKELLFGAQMREYEKRFARLEERLIKECVSLREETRHQLTSIEQTIHQRLDALDGALKSEQTQRDQALKGLNEEFKAVTQALEKELDQLEDQTSQRQRELRQQVLEQSKMLDDEIRQNYQEILTLLERRTQELRSEKADRAALASLFRELALRVHQHDANES